MVSMYTVYHGEGAPGHDAASRPQSISQLIEFVVVVGNLGLVRGLVSLYHTVRGSSVGGRANEELRRWLSNRGSVVRGPVNNMSISGSIAVSSPSCTICRIHIAVVKARQPVLLQVVKCVIENDMRVRASHTK